MSSSRRLTTWRSVSTTKPKLHLSQPQPTKAPMASEPIYQAGLSQFLWLPSSARRCSHQSR